MKFNFFQLVSWDDSDYDLTFNPDSISNRSMHMAKWSYKNNNCYKNYD